MSGAVNGPVVEPGRGMIYQGDVLEKLKEIESETVQTVCTSPPYWGLRDYGTDGQIGLEKTPEEYIERMVSVFREVKRVLKKDGTIWVNMGDSYIGGNNTDIGGNENFGSKAGVTKASKGSKALYTGLPAKNLIGVPWRLAFALQADGWYLRSDIIWSKPNPMPESVMDRPTKAHEYIFLLSKSERYYYDADAIREKGSIPEGTKAAKGSTERSEMPGVNSRPREYKIYDGMRNKRSVWEITTQPYPEAHFATFPEKIPELCIEAGSKLKDIVLDPFMGSGTTCAVAKKLGRNYIGIELNPEYVKLAERRIQLSLHNHTRLSKEENERMSREPELFV